MTPVPFGTLFTFIRNGLNVKQDKSGTGLPISRIETISNATIDGTRVGYADLTEAQCVDWLLQSGDILFSHINSVEHVGKCALYRGTPTKLVHGMNLLCLRPDTGKLVPKFARHLIQAKQFRSKLTPFINKAVNQASVSIGNLKSIEVDVPPLPEQRRIAAILDKADGLRARRRAALEQLNGLTQSVFLEMFGDPATNSQGWPVYRLGDVASEFRYGTSNKSQAHGKAALRIPNVIHGTIDTSDLKLVPVDDAEFERLRLLDGDILFVRTNGNPDFVGRCAVFDSRLASASSGCAGDEFVFASYLIRLRLKADSVSPVFLREFMSSPQGRRELRYRSKTSAGQFNINTEGLASIEVPIPPSAMQQQFGQRVQAVRRLTVSQEVSTSQFDGLFASLQHQAFSGAL